MMKMTIISIEEATKEYLIGMKLNETIIIDAEDIGWYVTRVIRGWIYSNEKLGSIFIKEQFETFH